MRRLAAVDGYSEESMLVVYRVTPTASLAGERAADLAPLD